MRWLALLEDCTLTDNGEPVVRLTAPGCYVGWASHRRDGWVVTFNGRWLDAPALAFAEVLAEATTSGHSYGAARLDQYQLAPKGD